MVFGEVLDVFGGGGVDLRIVVVFVGGGLVVVFVGGRLVAVFVGVVGLVVVLRRLLWSCVVFLAGFLVVFSSFAHLAHHQAQDRHLVLHERKHALFRGVLCGDCRVCCPDDPEHADERYEPERDDRLDGHADHGGGGDEADDGEVVVVCGGGVERRGRLHRGRVACRGSFGLNRGFFLLFLLKADVYNCNG